jgi:PAS domain S-box-containing protein
MNRESTLLNAITLAQARALIDIDSAEIFDGLLDTLLELTGSEYGFIGEVLYTDDQQQYLETRAFTDISWNEETRKFAEDSQSEGMSFYNLDSLFGQVLVTEAPVFANDPANDPRRAGLPEGHPPLNAFMGIPFRTADEVVGMIGLANREGGYDERQLTDLEPLLATCGNIVFSRRSKMDLDKTLSSLRDQEARHRTIVEAAIDAIITVTENGLIEFVNPAAERLFGYRAEELIGKKTGSSLMAEPWRSERVEDRRQFLKTGQSVFVGTRREVDCERKDGSRFPVELTMSEVRMAGGRMFTGLIRDLSERNAAEEKYRLAYADLVKSRDDMLAMLGQFEAGTVLIDSEGKVAFVSEPRRFAEGLLDSGIVGKAWDEVCPFEPGAAATLDKAMKCAPEDRTPEFFRWTNKQGEPWWFEVDVRDDPRDNGGRLIFIYDRSEIYNLRGELERARYGRIVGESPAMMELFGVIDIVAQGEWTVLIEGETGVGKELVAHSVHAASPRAEGAFVAVNCAGLTESLLASQLFGHKRGAFTGAVSDQEGFFEAAAGGTLLLDEIGDLPMAMQTSLLRALQEKEIVRLGESRPRSVDVRVLAATNRNLADEVAKGRFREDLFYRLRVARLSVPPLRERRDDIPLLLASFMSPEHGLGGRHLRISTAAMNLLKDHDWPGNVRELKNTAEYLFIHCRNSVVQIENLPPEIQTRGGFAPTAMISKDPWTSSGAVNEKDKVLAALASADGNRTRAARMLGISRATLYRRLDRLGIPTSRH